MKTTRKWLRDKDNRILVGLYVLQFFVILGMVLCLKDIWEKLSGPDGPIKVTIELKESANHD